MSLRLAAALILEGGLAWLVAGCTSSTPPSTQPAATATPWPAPGGLLDAFGEPDAMPAATARLALADPDLARAYRILRPNQDGGFKVTVERAWTGNPAAQTAACVDFRTGYGASPDAGRGADWCKEAAAQGYALGEYEYGQIYYRYEVAFNTFYYRDMPLGLHWLNRAAKHGIVQADFALIRANALGEGVTADKDLAMFYLQEARTRLRAAAQEAGHDTSCHTLPDYYAARYGLGQAVDIDRARTALQQAAEQDCWVAQLILASLYHYGTDGFPQDLNAAVFNTNRAARLEVAYAYGQSPEGWQP
ncbi:MAG TPA: tetratricopeptide repeat protein [Dongiaceae bacterium]|nr:tetratricopeptide repeat protein [Dongiaceae bacterium]